MFLSSVFLIFYWLSSFTSFYLNSTNAIHVTCWMLAFYSNVSIRIDVCIIHWINYRNTSILFKHIEFILNTSIIPLDQSWNSKFKRCPNRQEIFNRPFLGTKKSQCLHNRNGGDDKVVSWLWQTIGHCSMSWVWEAPVFDSSLRSL